MAEQAKDVSSSGLELKDPALLRSQCYINGQWVDGKETLEVINPATQEVMGTVPNLGAGETAQAVEAANAAWPSWRALLATERAQILRAWYALILEHADDLAAILTAEQGKPLAQSKGEIINGAQFIEWFAEEGRRTYGDLIPTHHAGTRLAVIKQPIGVSAAITPWNFPSSMITRKASAALAAGCPIVLKPASQTPFSALALAELAERAGIPPGVFSIVTGSASGIGGELTSNPTVRKLSFTGSTAVGKTLMAQCAENVTKVSLELGGNAPFIVFEDADVDAAVEGAMISKYRNSGQTCICANRIFVQESIYDAFAEKFAEAVQSMKVGAGHENDIDQGPMIDMAGVEKVEEHVADAEKSGGKIVVGGKRHELGGTFFEPTVITGATTDMKVFREETFGPLAPLFKFSTEEEVIAQANDTEYGLAAYFYTNDLGRVWRVSEALEYGMVGVNSCLLSTAQAPFGGIKESGIGREGSKYGIDEFLETKLIAIGGI